MIKKWSVEEEDFLRANYPKKGTKYCAAELNRSLVAIERKVQKLGVKRDSHNKTTDIYLEELLDKGIDIFPHEDYTGAHTNILHEHMACGYRWMVKPTNILSGKGCPCCKNGISPVLPTLLYCAKACFGSITFYKVGITNRTFEARYSTSERSHLELIWSKKFATGTEAYNAEQALLD